MGADLLLPPLTLSRRLSFALATPPLPAAATMAPSAAHAAAPVGGAPAFVEDSFFDWGQAYTDVDGMQTMSFELCDGDGMDDVVDSLIVEQHLAQAHAAAAAAAAAPDAIVATDYAAHAPVFHPAVPASPPSPAAAATKSRKRKVAAAKAAPPPPAPSTRPVRLRARVTPPVSVPHSDEEDEDSDGEDADEQDSGADQDDEEDAPLPRMSVKQMQKYNKMTPKEQAKYRAYRRRNNRASKKSREKARVASQQVQTRIVFLESENTQLRMRLEEATKQLVQLREIVTRGNMLPSSKKSLS